MKVVFRNANCKIVYNEKLHAIQTEWNELPFSSKTLRIIMNWMITGLNVYRCSTVIADTRRMNMIWQEDRNWIIETWLPKATKAGLRLRAMIVSPDSTGELVVKKIAENYNNNLVTTVYFTDYPEAIMYLQSVISYKYPQDESIAPYSLMQTTTSLQLRL